MTPIEMKDGTGAVHRVFLTGATGFVGREVVRRLVGAGYIVRCLIRPGSAGKLPRGIDLEIHEGDAREEQSLQGALADCEALIHLIGIIREIPSRGVTFEKLHFQATLNMVRAAQNQGVRRFLQMSANGCREKTQNPYLATKWRAECSVAESGLEWTIFRPSVIFGPGDGFVNLLARVLRFSPVMPVFGDGAYRLAPVAVADVAAAFVAALSARQSIGRKFHLCGPAALTYTRILDTIAESLGRRTPGKIFIPESIARPLASLGENLPLFPLTRTQLELLLEGNECPEQEWKKVFGIDPRPFEADSLHYLRTSGKKT
ncbi:MAG: NAD(P)H-binding protein [Desulfuromonadaceae bacterium]|nr:NAD(P)H-binding protein [Desulfuromonadaceae bacterium]